MSTPIDLFDYDLPPESIAQTSVEPRDAARLLKMDRSSGKREHLSVRDLPDLLEPGDLLVFNNTKVFKARLEAKLRDHSYELFLLRCLESGSASSRWKTLIKRARRFHLGEDFLLGELSARVVEGFKDETGAVEIEIEASQSRVLEHCEAHGRIPIPTYVEQEPDELEDYQTVYAKVTGSVAAPTAGFHFTDRLLNELKAKGVRVAFVTLHVGLGTFQPVKTETLEEHQMHSEWVEIPEETVNAIYETQDAGKRIVAVGTTTVRTLEGIAAKGSLETYAGDVNLFITPGFEFKVVDALITNFHLPKSTLLALASAFAGRENILAAYKEAVEKGYRFYSFGDAMLLL